MSIFDPINPSCPVTGRPIPKDLAGFQFIPEGNAVPGDLLLDKITREKRWCDIDMGVQSCFFDVYRKIPCPKAGDNDKSWKESRQSAITHKFLNRQKDQEKLDAQPLFQQHSSGAIREVKKGKGRFDLIPYEPFKQLAIHFEDGGYVHGDRNWEKGLPLSTYLSAAKRHAAQAGGLKDENHAIASCWNFFCLIQTAKWIELGKLPKELDDIGWTNLNLK